MRARHFTLDDLLAQFPQRMPQDAAGPRARSGARAAPGRGDGPVLSLLRRMRGIRDAMTAGERERPDALNSSRRRRVAAGAGVSITEVSQLIRQYEMARDLMRRAPLTGAGATRGVVLGLVTGDPLHRDPSCAWPELGRARPWLDAAVAVAAASAVLAVAYAAARSVVN